MIGIAIAHTARSSGDTEVFNQLTWSWGVELLLNAVIMFTCQIFLTYRFTVISEKNWWMTSVLASLALTQLVIGITSGARGLVKGVTLVKVASS